MLAGRPEVQPDVAPIDRGLRVLYLVYWGGAEPLGRSLVVPAVCRLAASARISLVTFEKPRHLRRIDEMESVRSVLDRAGVVWLVLRYHKWPKWTATAFDILHGIARGALEALRRRPDLVHGRTFVGGLMGVCIARLLRVRFVYHAEGAYADEQVDCGVWQAQGPLHRLASSLERWLFALADGIIVLSEEARKRVTQGWRGRRSPPPVIVVPSAVDARRFSTLEAPVARDPSDPTFVYMGSIGGRYRLDRVVAFVAAVRSVFGRARLEVLTPLEPARAEATLCAGPLPRECWHVKSVSHDQIPLALARCHVGVHFLQRGLSGPFGSPAKIGEYWAAGLPIAVTPGIGDTEEIIRRERVGVIVRDDAEAGFLVAARELQDLLRDEETAQRCRRAASRYYGLEQACSRQLALYDAVVAGTSDAG
jgi:glycosyltransferase involved in cell wall biosynthesis